MYALVCLLSGVYKAHFFSHTLTDKKDRRKKKMMLNISPRSSFAG